MSKRKLVDLVCGHCGEVAGQALPSAQLLHCSRCKDNKRSNKKRGKKKSAA